MANMLDSPRRMAAAELLEAGMDMENPASTGEMGELLVKRDLFPKWVKEGDKVAIHGIVGKIGSKVSFMPYEVVAVGVRGKSMGTDVGEDERPSKY